jgi:enoyl-CoA hydratase/carnithine racemase
VNDSNDDRVLVSVEGGVASVCLNRPDKRNALDPLMFSALADAAARVRDTAGLRAVVLHGAGASFCAGMDLAMMSGALPDLRPPDALSDALSPEALAPRSHGCANLWQHVAMAWRDMPVPVIAAIQDVAFGGGLQIALGADLRYVAPGARLSVMEVNWGLVPDMGGILLMSQLAASDVVRELTFSGRVFQGVEAMRLGLATRVCDDPLAAAYATAREFAQKSPDAIRAAKRLLNGVLGRRADQVLRSESYEQQRLIGSANQIEAVSARMGARDPRFAEAGQPQTL